MPRKRTVQLLLAALAVSGGSVIAAGAASAGAPSRAPAKAIQADPSTSTPIKHLVVIFQENVSFDHYFGTYPHATNPKDQPQFTAAPGTPTVNGLSGALLTNNPNLSNPQRLNRNQALTCDQNHDYTAEQQAFDNGLMDKFVQYTQTSSCSPPDIGKPGLVMDYYDGNTVTGLWNYAQKFAMSDNSYSTTFGPSTPGAINVTGANTYGTLCGPSSAVYNSSPCTDAPGAVGSSPGFPQPAGSGTTYNDADPNFDVCSGGGSAGTIQIGGKNIGDLLNQAGLTWGWFEGGFASPGYVSGKPNTDNLGAVCTGTHKNIGGAVQKDYSPHHEPFQYYRSTANPQHLPPTSVAMIGRQDQANHQYDLADFWAAARHGSLPAVSYLKAARYQDGHPGYSDPLDEQHFLVNTINRLEKLPTWSSTAVVIMYDDSDGWYDHQLGPIVTQSQTPLDALTGTGMCGSNAAKVPMSDSGAPEQARCGVGPRQPLLVISPYAKPNFVDGTFTNQSSIPRFIEDNWLGGQRIGNGASDASAGPLDNMFDFSGATNTPPLILKPSTGEPAPGAG